MKRIPSQVNKNRKRIEGFNRLGTHLRKTQKIESSPSQTIEEINDQINKDEEESIGNSPLYQIDGYQRNSEFLKIEDIRNDEFQLLNRDSDDSSYEDYSEEDSNDELSLEEILDDDYFENPEGFRIQNEATEVIDKERNNINEIDTGFFDVFEDVILPWMLKRNKPVLNDLGLAKIYPGSDFCVKELAADVRKFIDTNVGYAKIARKIVEEDLMVNILMNYLLENAQLP